jgi:PAS domain S-box-containing protein
LEPVYGLPPGTFDGATTALFQNLIHPDDRASVMKLADCALKTGQPTTGEWRIFWPDGSIHWIAGRWQVFMDESGEPFRVLGANIDVTERKQTEEAFLEVNRALEAQAELLQSREDLLKIFVKHVPAAVAMLDRDMRYLQVSDRWCADYSLGSSEILGRSHYEIFPDLPQRWKEMHRRGLEGETVRVDEDRWDRQGGTTIWVRREIRPWKTSSGIVGGILIFSEDITHRKHAEEELLDMSRKLIEAHEQERTRIGRDLHDDVVQRLVMLALELGGVQQDVPDSASEVRSRIGTLQNETTSITNDVQLLSHELHNSKLEYLGIVGAAKNFCKELSARQNVEIDFQSHDLPTTLPNELSLSLFRVLQEALRNATKHSGVKYFEVRLWGNTGEAHLTVSDLGAGFDTETTLLKSTGLGLTSMQERLRLVHGELSINSQPKGGTTIHARIPFDSTSDSARAAG